MEPIDEGNPSGKARRRPAHPALERRLRICGAFLIVAMFALALDSVLGPGGNESSIAAADRGADSPWQRARARLARESRIVDRTLRRTSYVSAGAGNGRTVALTFDDGPGAQTAAILETLDRFDAEGTFFSLGTALDAHPRQTRATLLAGHAVGNHTYEHARLAYLPEEDQAREIDLTTKALRKAGPQGPRLFRPPYGSFDATTLELLRKRRLLMVLWSIDATDFGGATADGIAERVLSEIRPGSIVLMHDGGGDRTQTVAALPKVLEGLQRRGLEAVTVPELLAANPPPRDQPAPVALDGTPP